MTVWRARLSWRSPPRLRRWRMVRPLEAGSGATPASRANAASLRTRSWCDQVTISCAATIGPTPGSSSSSGTSRADVSRGSRARARSASRVAAWMRRASERRTRIVASWSGVRELERRKRLQRRSSSPTGSRRSSLAQALRCGHDHAAQLDDRDRGGRRRRCAGRARAGAEPLAAARIAAEQRAVLASAERATADRVEQVVLALQPPLATSSTS